MAKRTLTIGIKAMIAINKELRAAAGAHGNQGFNSLHEGYAVLLEEVDELWMEIKHGESSQDLRNEAVQVAAMAIRILNELT